MERGEGHLNRKQKPALRKRSFVGWVANKFNITSARNLPRLVLCARAPTARWCVCLCVYTCVYMHECIKYICILHMGHEQKEFTILFILRSTYWFVFSMDILAATRAVSFRTKSTLSIQVLISITCIIFFNNVWHRVMLFSNQQWFTIERLKQNKKKKK